MTCSTTTATKRQNSTRKFYRYLESLNENRYKFTLARVKKALKLLGRPQDGFDVIHIAGSNGKGSVASYLSSILAEHGIKTGLYTSPHLKSPEERIKINNTDVRAAVFSSEGLCLKSFLEAAKISLTYFEFLTVLCFVIFRKNGVRAAVIETGLGGRLDATNAGYKRKVLSILTSVSLEHTCYLGNTRKKILLEKEKIIGSSSCVHNLNDAKLSRLLEKLHPGMILDARKAVGLDGAKADGKHCEGEYGYAGGIRLKTKMAEPVQLENLRTVLAALKIMEKRGYVFDPVKIRRAVSSCVVRARFEKKNGVYLSTAHNPEAFEKFCEALDMVRGGKKAVIVFSLLEDKDICSILKILAERKNLSLVLTKAQSPRALAIEKMERIVVKYGIKFKTVPDNEQALNVAKKAAKGGVVAVAGSFYLAGRFA